MQQRQSWCWCWCWWHIACLGPEENGPYLVFTKLLSLQAECPHHHWQDRAGPGARWKCLIRSHKGSGECGVYCLNRDTARCWSALYCPLPGQGRKHVNMNEYTRLPGYTDSPSACPVCKMPQHTCCGGLLSVLSMSSGGWCSTVSPPVSLFIFTVFCGRKYPSRTQWLENATISFCCELLSSLMNAVKDHWGAGGLAGPRRGDPAAVMVL